MIGLEQWRAAIGGWHSGNLSAIYRRYGSRRIVRNWPKLLLIMDNYIYYCVCWLIVLLFPFTSEDGPYVALSLAYDSSVYSHGLSTFVKSPSPALLIRSGHDSMRWLWGSTNPSVTATFRTFRAHLYHVWTMSTASPSAGPTLRLLLALSWLLIVAGDVELHPGPQTPAGYKKLQQERDTIIQYLADQKVSAQLADKLLGAGFITRPVYDLATNYAPKVVDRDRIAVMFDAVISSMKLNPSKYSTFLRILKDIEGLGDIVAFIDGGDEGVASSDGDGGDGRVTGFAEILSTVDDTTELCNDWDFYDIYEEVASLAERWRKMCTALRLLPGDAATISKNCNGDPDECLQEVLEKWLNKSYNTDRHGLPTWKMLVKAVANKTGGNNPELAIKIAENHQQVTAGSSAATGTMSSIATTPSSYTGVRQTSKDMGTSLPGQHTRVHSDDITLYMEHLQRIYQRQIPSFRTLQWPPSPTKTFLRLAMIRGNTMQYGSIDEHMIRLRLDGRVIDILDRKQPVELKDIFEIDDAKRKVILIEGSPGSGKSTLAWSICTKWASGELFHNFQTVLHVQLRDPAIQSAKSLEDIFLPVPAVSEIKVEKVVAEFQACSGQDLLVVMDGWDEFPLHLRSDSIIYQLIASPEKLYMHCSAVVITSRPLASGDLNRIICSRIEILGFTPTEVEGYFSEALKGDSLALQKLQEQLQERPVIQASCYLPLNAAIVTHLFLAQNQTLPTTLHAVFCLLVLGCLKCHEAKQNKGTQHIKFSSLHNLPQHLQELFGNICALAYHGVIDNKATFPVDYLESLELPREMETLGLIQGVHSFESLDTSVSYNFLQLSVQELLASFYISRLPGKEQGAVIQKMFGERCFAAVFRFYAAFTKLESEEVRTVVGDIVKDNKKSQLLYLLHGLYEAQDLSLCQFIGSQLGGELGLRSTILSSLDCSAVGYFISCILQIKVDFSECSLDHHKVGFLTKEWSKHNLTATDSGVSSCPELNLNLSENGISDKGVAVLAEALTVNQPLMILDLEKNAISASGAITLAESLKHNNSLHELHLWNNEISDEGACALADALMENESLSILNLCSNYISDEGTGAIAKALKVNESLTVLDLWNNRITDKGALTLGKALKKNISLTTLNLSGNQISDKGARAFGEALKVNQGLKILNLQQNRISDMGAGDICEALRVNHTLITLKLWANPIKEITELLTEFSGRVTLTYSGNV